MLNDIGHILSDPAHAVSEMIWEFSFLFLGMLISRWQSKREHRKHHEETRPNLVPSDWKSHLQPPRPSREPYDFVLGLDPNEPIPYTMPTKEDNRG